MDWSNLKPSQKNKTGKKIDPGKWQIEIENR